MIVKKRVLINSIICLFVLATVIGCGNADGKTEVETTDSRQENLEETIVEETTDEQSGTNQRQQRQSRGKTGESACRG